MQAESPDEKLKAAINADRCYSKARLRDEFRMKPKEGARPVKEYKNGYGQYFGVYRIADCVPMKEQIQREPTARQLHARKILSLKGKLRGNGARAGWVADQWLAQDCLVLDVESTGLGQCDQIIEIALVDGMEQVLFSSRVKPSVPIDPGAHAKHGITLNALADAPTWTHVVPYIRDLVVNRPVVIFNEEFDSRMIIQTCRSFGIDPGWWNDVSVHCAMALAADAYGATNRYGTISLQDAVAAAGVQWRGSAHTAVADCMATIGVVSAIAWDYRRLADELSALEGRHG